MICVVNCLYRPKLIPHLPAATRYLLVLQFDTHYSEGVVGSVVVDVDATEALLPRLNGHPLLTAVVIDHD